MSLGFCRNERQEIFILFWILQPKNVCLFCCRRHRWSSDYCHVNFCCLLSLYKVADFCCCWISWIKNVIQEKKESSQVLLSSPSGLVFLSFVTQLIPASQFRRRNPNDVSIARKVSRRTTVLPTCYSWQFISFRVKRVFFSCMKDEEGLEKREERDVSVQIHFGIQMESKVPLDI